MDSQLKQRLVGAVVLVALAVIFVPMLLDGREDSSMPLFGSNIPDKPGYHFEPLAIPSREPGPLQARPAVVEQEDAEPVTTGPLAQQEPELEVLPVPAESESTAPTEPSKPVEPTEPSGPTEQTEQSKPAVVASAPSQTVTGFAVQVGSFSSAENATGLRDRLRKQGFAAFVEQVKSGGGSVYRVRLGPEASRERAEALKQRLLAKEPDLPALVLSHP